MSPRAGSPRSLPGDAKAGGDNGAYDAAAGLTSLLATLGERRRAAPRPEASSERRAKPRAAAREALVR